jgi:hypothetical protein
MKRGVPQSGDCRQIIGLFWRNEFDQPDGAGRWGMAWNLLFLVLWGGWCGECTGWFNLEKRVLGDYRT